MRKIILIICGIICSLTINAQWKAYLSYYEPTEIEQAGDGTLYVLASGGLFSYNPKDQEVQTYNKTTVLSDCGISHIAWCQAAKRLVILYDDYNIDLLSPNGNVVNMPSYMNTSMTDDKTVYSIDVSGNYAYLSTSFGVVQLDVADASFTNTYRLGFRVDYTYTDGDYLYAASSTNGTYRGLMTDNLHDPNQWTRTANYTARPKTMDPTLLTTVQTLNPGGPKYNHFGEMKFKYGNLYTVSGGFGPTSELNYPGTVQVLKQNDSWQIYQDSLQNITGHGYVDNLTIDVDPIDTSHVFVGGRTGLYEFRNGRYVRDYNIDNSPLQSATGKSKNYVLIEGITYDNNGNLWILNSAASSQSVLELTTDGEFVSHHSSTFISPENNLSLYSMISPYIDSRNILWFGNQHWYTPGLYGYNISNGQAYAFHNITNEDGTTYNITVKAVKEDLYNNLWIGTTSGPFMLETSEMSNENPIFTQVKVPRNDGTDYADYLLSGVDINSIIIDRANRKWFGTGGNGLYLISSDNIHQLQHFTKDNSPLLSDNITSLALNENTGELFIGTDHGLCSFTSRIPSNADEGMTKDNVYAYPNPVKPEYNGAITITGLDDNADVKIVTSSGALVNEGKASNGQYKWYGLDRDGKRVASGIYMVEVATAEGEKGVVCKIAIIR